MYKPHLPKKSFAPFFALILATVIWGGALPVIKLTEAYIPPFSFLLLRFILVCILMLPIVFIELKATPVHPKDIKNLILLGLFGQASLAFIFWGVKYTSTIDTALISTVAPLMIIFAGHHFYNEKVTYMTKWGVAIATIGTALIVFEPLITKSNVVQDVPANLRLLGNFLVVMYNILFTIYIIYSKVVMGKMTNEVKSFLKFIHVEKMQRAYSPLLSTAITFYVGLAAMIPFALFENLGGSGMTGIDFSKLTVTPILGIVYMAVLSSIVAYIAYEWGLSHSDVADGAIFGYLGPLFTIPFSFLLLGEIPTNTAVFGSIIITIGVVIAEKYKVLSKH